MRVGKYQIIISVFVGLISGLVLGYLIFSNSSTGNLQKLRICPDEWYIDLMPKTGINFTRDQYLIVNGERRELSEFDVDWIRKNCIVNEPTPVY